MGDQGVHGRHRERVAADQQRVKRQDDAQPRVFHVPGDQRVEAGQAAHAQHVGDDLEHVREVRERHGAHFFVAERIGQFTGFQELLVAGHVARRQARHLAEHVLRVTVVIEGFTVVEAQPEKRLHGTQVHVVAEASAAEIPQLLEEKRRGHDRRPGVEGVTVLPEYVGAPAGGIEFLDDGHPEAAGSEADGGGEATEARTDHYRLRRAVDRWARRGRENTVHSV